MGQTSQTRRYRWMHRCQVRSKSLIIASKSPIHRPNTPHFILSLI